MTHITLSRTAKALIAAAFLTAPAMADWGNAESDDFSLNTVPEPAAMLVIAAAALLTARSRY